MEFKVVFLILGIAFWLFRQFTKEKIEGKPAAPKPMVKANTSAPAGKPKSIDDIFNEFVKEVENKQKVNQPKPAMAKKVVPPTIAKKTLDWQQVDKTQIKAKKQLISHGDYEDVSHRIDSSHHNMTIEESEAEAYQFDIEKIDWRDAVIAKEILDRKYA